MGGCNGKVSYKAKSQGMPLGENAGSVVRSLQSEKLFLQIICHHVWRRQSHGHSNCTAFARCYRSMFAVLRAASIEANIRRH